MAFEAIEKLERPLRSTSGDPEPSEPKGSTRPMRVVHLDLPKERLHLVKELKGMETFNPTRHRLKMVKGGFGLKDALGCGDYDWMPS